MKLFMLLPKSLSLKADQKITGKRTGGDKNEKLYFKNLHELQMI